MSLTTAAPKTDLLIPRPGPGETWDPHTIHTHYFGLSVPEAAIGAFVYLRCQPTFDLCSGGVCLFRGLDNIYPLDIEHVGWTVTMPYPEVAGRTIATTNGLAIEFTEPGRQVGLRYRSADGSVDLDVIQTAVTPLLARGHVMPGEDRDSDPAHHPGGSEQFMHCTGELTLGGDRYDVDCFPVRDRSWRQIRTESEVLHPPVGWSPMRFGDDLMFNQISFEPPDTGPAWLGHFDVPADRPTHHYGWVWTGAEALALRSVHRRVLRRHPVIGAATAQEIEAVDETGVVRRFRGEALAMAHLPSWATNFFVDSVYRWEDDAGRVAHCTYQETWYATYQRALRRG